MTGAENSAPDMVMNRILIIGGTGYIGKYMAKASVSLGYPTYVLVRPSTAAAPDSFKEKLLQEFKDIGIHILQGSLDDHNSLVDAIKLVDVVISAVAIPQHLDQFNIINAIKEAGIANIKRFVPSEFGNEVDTVEALPPFQRVCDNKKKIRRVIEEEGIPFTFFSANSYASYFVDYFFHPRQKPEPEEVVIYGDGLTKAYMNSEDDIAALMIMMESDFRTMNKLVIYRPPGNIISQLVSLWENKTDKVYEGCEEGGGCVYIGCRGAKHGYCQRIDKQWHRNESVLQFLDPVLQSGIPGLHASNGIMKCFSAHSVKLTDLGWPHVDNVNL